MSIKVGVAGLGGHAQRRILPAIAKCPAIEVTAIWTRDEKKFALLDSNPEVTLTTNLDGFLESGIDVVYLCTPTGLHYEHGIKVLGSGISLWCEKPIATSASEAKDLLLTAKQNNLSIRDSYMFTYHQQARKLKQMLSNQPLGQLRTINLRFCFPHLSRENFRYDPSLGGGAFLDHACYLVKALDFYIGGSWEYLGGCIERDTGYDVDTSGAALLRHETGIIANLRWGFGSCYINEMEVIGEDGRIQVEMPFTKPAGHSCNILTIDGSGKKTVNHVAEEDPFTQMFNAFASSFSDKEQRARHIEEMTSHNESFFGLLENLRS